MKKTAFALVAALVVWHTGYRFAGLINKRFRIASYEQFASVSFEVLVYIVALYAIYSYRPAKS